MKKSTFHSEVFGTPAYSEERTRKVRYATSVLAPELVGHEAERVSG